jgi:hypothetical protein
VKWLLAAAGLILGGLGADGMYQAMRDRTATTVTCSDLAAGLAVSNHLRVSGCEIDLSGAGYHGQPDALTEVYVVTRVPGSSAPGRLIVASRDPSTLSAAQAVLALTRTGRTAAALAAARSRFAAALQPDSTLDGLARSGVVERGLTRRLLSGLPRPVADDAVILDLGGKPDFAQPALALVAGTLLGALAFATPARGRPSRPPTASPDSGETMASASGAGAGRAHSAPPLRSVKIPRLLLLHVDQAAGPDAVEHAPPLGTRDDVIGILRGAVDELELDAAGRTLRHRSGALTLDLGVQDPVPAIVVDARGEAGAALAREILLVAGWRAFVPKTGLFVTADDLAAIGELAADE